MSLVSKKPAELKPQNDLDAIPADLLGPVPHMLKLGQNNLLILESQMKRNDYLDVVLRLRIKGSSDIQPTPDSEVQWSTYAALVAAWVKGDPEPPNPEEPQPSLFGDGEAGDEPEALGSIIGTIGDGVDRPGFSNLTGSGE